MPLTETSHPFLPANSEMAALIRAKDWTTTPLGPISGWPQNLLHSLNLMLSSKSAMSIWWGPQLVQFYNDACGELIGHYGKHHAAPGQTGADGWPEIWAAIHPRIDAVFTTGEAIIKKDVLLPVYRNNTLADAYWSFTYNPIKNEQAVTEGVLVICMETTNYMVHLQQIAAAEKKFRNTVSQAAVGIAILRGKNMVVEMANPAFLQMADKTEAVFVGKPFFDILPEVRTLVEPSFLQVMATGTPYFENEFEVVVNRHGKKETAFFNVVYQPVTEEDGIISGVLVVANEVSVQVKARHALAETEKQFRNMVMQSPIPTTILRGKDFIIEIANYALLQEMWRRNPDDVQGKKLLDVFPELQGQKFPQLLQQVLQTGKPYKENEAIAIVSQPDGALKKFYLDYEYAPLHDSGGTVTGIMATIYDVTEKVETRQSLKEAAERLSLATEGTQLAIWDLNLTTREIIYTPRLTQIFGYTDATILSHQQMRDHIHPADIKVVEAAFGVALQTGIYSYEARVVQPNGAVRWIKTIGKAIFNEQNEPVRMLGTMRDITESKDNEEKVAKLAAIVQSSADVIIGKNMDGIITSWNASAERVLGYTADEMIGQPVEKLIPDHLKDEEPAILAKLKNGEHVSAYETFRITKEKRLLNISLSISPVKDRNGNIIGASKIMRDITEQKQAEKLIRQSEEKFRLLSDSMPQLIWTSDKEGNLNYFNQAVYAYSGLTRQELAADGWLTMVHPEDRPENIRKWMLAVGSGEDFILEHRFKKSDGEYRWQLSRAVAQKDSRGKIQMWVGTSTDIDDIKKHEQQKDYFIKMASHELKTPITTIKGYIQLLLKTHGSGMDSLLSNSLFTIDKQIVKLTKLITDLLDVSKIETGSLELDKEQFVLSQLVKEMANDLETTTGSHRITYSASSAAVVLADKDRIAQVISNLLTNAVKYSPRAAEIIVNVANSEDSVVVSVQDFGIGISPEDHEKVFERFYRVAGKDEKTFPGFGIGLFIVNEIVMLHNGKIWLNSDKEQGATFYFSLPVYDENNT